MRQVKRRGERKETVTDKDLYRAILNVLQSHSVFPRAPDRSRSSQTSRDNQSGVGWRGR